MGLQLLCGPASSGKVRSIVDGFVEACRAGGGAWLVVPTQGDVARARLEIAARETMLLGARVGTFNHLVRELAGEFGEALDSAAAAVLVRRCIERSVVLSPALAWPGFVRHAQHRLTQLRAAAAVDPSSLEEQLATVPTSERAAWRRLVRDVEQAFAHAGLRDSTWYEAEALRRLRREEPKRLVPVFAYGFDDLSPVQERLLLELGRRVEVTLSLPFVPGRMVFERRQQLVTRCAAAGARVEAGGTAGFHAQELAQLEQAFGEPTAEPLRTTSDALRFAECCGALQEAETIAREVGRFRRDGIAAERIAVLSPAVAALRPILEPLLQRAGIEAAFEAGRLASDTPAGRALLDLLDAARDDDPLAWLAFARSRVSGLSAQDVDAHEQELLPRLDAAAPGGPGWWRRGLRVPAALRRLLDVRRGHELQAVRGALGALVPEQPGDVRLLAAVASLLDSLAAVDAEEPVRLEEIRDAVGAMPIPAPVERRPGMVVVAPVTRVRTDRFDAVVLCSLHSGGFGTAGTADGHDAASVARELTYIGFTRATSRVTFVRQAAGSDGRVRAAHPVWMELRRLLPDVQVERTGLHAVVPPPAELLLASEARSSLALALGEGALLPSCLPAGMADLQDRLRPAERAQVARHCWEPATDEPLELSVSDVEEYAGCPARWFVRRRLLRREPPSSRQVVGLLVHDALAELVPRLGAVGARGAAIEQAVAAAERTLPAAAVVRPVDRARACFVTERLLHQEQVYGDEVLSELGFGGSAEGELPALEIGGARLRGRIDRVDVAAGGAAVVHDYKLSRSAPAALKLVDEGRLQAPLYWEALRRSGRFQPVAALYRPLEGPRPRGIIDGDAAPRVDGEYRTDRLAGDAAQEIVAAAVHETERVVEQMRAGKVPTSPRGGSCPDWCDLGSICRVESR